MNKFNRLFQKSTQNTTCQLYTEMSRLVRLYASNLLKPECIVAVGDDLSQLNLATQNQLADENLGLGDATWTYISGMEEELDPKTLYKAVRSFYVASLEKMLKRFPFGDSIFQDLGIINPDQVCSYDFTTVERFAKHFPQLNLNVSQSIDYLRIEFMDFKLSPAELPTPDTYMSATGDDKPRPGRYWKEVSRMRTFDGEMRFPLLAKLITGDVYSFIQC